MELFNKTRALTEFGGVYRSALSQRHVVLAKWLVAVDSSDLASPLQRAAIIL